MVTRDLVVPVADVNDTIAIMRLMQIETGDMKPAAPPDPRVIYLEIKSQELKPGTTPLIMVRRIGKNGLFNSPSMDISLLEGAELLAYMKASGTSVIAADGKSKTFDDIMTDVKARQ